MFDDILVPAVLSIDHVLLGLLPGVRSSCGAAVAIVSLGLGAVCLTRVCHLCDDTQAFDLPYLRRAAGVPDPRVM